MICTFAYTKKGKITHVAKDTHWGFLIPSFLIYHLCHGSLRIRMDSSKFSVSYILIVGITCYLYL